MCKFKKKCINSILYFHKLLYFTVLFLLVQGSKLLCVQSYFGNVLLPLYICQLPLYYYLCVEFYWAWHIHFIPLSVGMWVFYLNKNICYTFIIYDIVTPINISSLYMTILSTLNLIGAYRDWTGKYVPICLIWKPHAEKL